MNPFQIYNPTRMIVGRNTLDQLPQQIPDRWRRLLIVTDERAGEKSGALPALRKFFGPHRLAIFQQVEENPSFETVDRGKMMAIEKQADAVIGVGGGSVLDAAKAIALISTHDISARELVEGARVETDPLPIVCLPTTSGTGSEVTPYIVLTDRANHNKCGYGHEKLFPRLALVDPQCTFSMPRHLVIATGLDALTHGVEAFLCTESFPLNDHLALSAVTTVRDNLQRAAEKDDDAMTHMAVAAMVAGLAITNSGTILPHIMGYPLTTFHGVPHGTASAVTLPRFLSFLEKKGTIPDKVARVKNIFATVGGLENFLGALNVSTNLADYGVETGEIEIFVEKTLVKGDIYITPAPITADDIKTIYNL